MSKPDKYVSAHYNQKELLVERIVMRVTKCSIPGVLLLTLDIDRDKRGSFCELMQLAKMRQLGLPKEFRPVQTNLSKSRYGVIRGIHAEPWDKLIAVPMGAVFTAIVDLRPDSSAFRQVETFGLDKRYALFVPKGCGNSFGSIAQETLYLYNVSGHWQEGLPYLAIAYDDPDLAIPWPIPEKDRVVSEKDRANPSFAEYKKAVDK